MFWNGYFNLTIPSEEEIAAELEYAVRCRKYRRIFVLAAVAFLSVVIIAVSCLVIIYSVSQNYRTTEEPSDIQSPIYSESALVDEAESATKSEEKSAAEISSEVSLFGTVNVSTYLNLRAGVGTDKQIIGHLFPDELVQVTGNLDDWYAVTVPEKYGYVSSHYLKISEADPNCASVDVISYLNLRTGAGIEQKIIGHLLPDAQVRIIKEAQGWCFIEVLETNGYVYGSYVELTESKTG